MFNHVIWDWNGTLLDDVEACVQAINILLGRRGMPRVDRARYTAVFGFPVQEYYRQLGFDFGREDWNRVAAEYHDVYDMVAVNAPLRAGARATLEQCRGAGLALSVLSACEQVRLEQMMRERGVHACFERICGRADVYAHSKLELGRELLSAGRWRAHESVLVGDTTHDCEVAQALGIACLLMTGGHQSEARLRPCGCPLVADMDGVRRALAAWGEPVEQNSGRSHAAEGRHS